MSRQVMIEKLTCTTITRRNTIKLDATMLRALLKVPDNARVFFHVPSGGDDSNMAVDIDGQTPVWIEWTEETVEDTRS